MGKVADRAKVLYTEFIATIEGTVLPISEVNKKLVDFLTSKGIENNSLLYDAVFDCKEECFLKDVGIDGKLPEGDYSSCGV